MAHNDGLTPRFLRLLLAVLALFLGAAGFAAAADDAPVGEVSFVIGAARIAAGPDSPRDLLRGAKVRAGQVLETGDNGHIHLRFVDGGSVAVRPQSRLRIEEYHYDPVNPRENRVKFSLEQGTLRSITGNAGQAAKDRFRLNTPIAAIGIKGTDFIVQATRDATRVAVNSGAIVMAPLGDACRAEALGPCNIASARELTAAMAGRYLELKARSPFPEILQIDQNSPFSDKNGVIPLDGAARSRRINNSAGDVAPLVSAASTLAAVAPSAALDPPVVPPPAPPAPVVVVPPPAPVVVVPPPVPVVVEPPPPPVVVEPPPPPVVVVPPPAPVALASIPVVPQIWWGRWAPFADPALPASSYAVQMAVPGREYAAGNDVFGMLRETAVVSRLPSAGRVDFTLAQSEVYLVQGPQLKPAIVTGASLGVDFDAHRFTTQLAVVPPGMSLVNLSSQGSLQGDGRFMADKGQAMWVYGALSMPSGQQAGYAFQMPLNAAQSLSGATLWVH